MEQSTQTPEHPEQGRFSWFSVVLSVGALASTLGYRGEVHQLRDLLPEDAPFEAVWRAELAVDLSNVALGLMVLIAVLIVRAPPPKRIRTSWKLPSVPVLAGTAAALFIGASAYGLSAPAVMTAIAAVVLALGFATARNAQKTGGLNDWKIGRTE